MRRITLKALLAKPRTARDILDQIRQIEAERSELELQRAALIQDMALGWGADSGQDEKAAQHAAITPKLDAANAALELLQRHLTRAMMREIVQAYAGTLDETFQLEQARDAARQKAALAHQEWKMLDNEARRLDGEWMGRVSDHERLLIVQRYLQELGYTDHFTVDLGTLKAMCDSHSRRHEAGAIWRDIAAKYGTDES